MFGPLPQLHRILVVITTLAVGIGSGIWMSESTALPFAAAGGAGWGALAGGLLGYLLLHECHHRAHPVHLRRH